MGDETTISVRMMWIVWAGMMFLMVSGAHYFVWVRLARSTALPGPWRIALAAVLVALALSVPASIAVSRTSQGWLADALTTVAFSWFGFLGILLFMLLGFELLRGVLALSAKLGGPDAGLGDPGRRLFASRMVAGAVGVTALGLGSAALGFATRAPVLKKLKVALKRLPEKLSGLRVVQISDIHLGQPIGRAYFADVVRRVNERSPDIVAITGDLVDGDTELIRDLIEPLKDLKARHGIFFVTGNHEYYSGVEPWIAYLRDMGVQVLRNEHVRVGEGSDSLVVAGVDDIQGARFAKDHGPDLDRALEGVGPDDEVLLLAHRPREIHNAAKRKVGLQLSGHTHGGQIWPLTMFVGLAEPYSKGLHQHGESQIYVNTGTGVWGPRMRLGTESEITELELVRG